MLFVENRQAVNSRCNASILSSLIFSAFEDREYCCHFLFFSGITEPSHVKKLFDCLGEKMDDTLYERASRKVERTVSLSCKQSVFQFANMLHACFVCNKL